METLNKKQVNKGTKSMAKKAASWSQVCKQLSGIGGYIEIGEGEKVRPIELMRSLGVHVSKNSYKPADIFVAWSERMRDGKQVLISHGVPYTIDVMGYTYRLCVPSKKEEGKYVGVSVKHLCPLVSADDKDTNTVTVNAANVLKGLRQSLYVEDTLAAIKKSEDSCAAMCEGYINLTRDKKSPAQYVHVSKDKDGVWTFEPEKAAVATSAKAAAKEGAKKLSHKAIEMIKEANANCDMGLWTEAERDNYIKEAKKVG